MASKKGSRETTKVLVRKKVNRPNRHSKKKSSHLKSSKNYKKLYKGQGR